MGEISPKDVLDKLNALETRLKALEPKPKQEDMMTLDEIDKHISEKYGLKIPLEEDDDEDDDFL